MYQDESGGSWEASYRRNRNEYVDFFGENDTIALEIIQDIKDILGGRLTSIISSLRLMFMIFVSYSSVFISG